MLGFSPPCLMMPVVKKMETMCKMEDKKGCSLHNLYGFGSQSCASFHISGEEIKKNPFTFDCVLFYNIKRQYTEAKVTTDGDF